MQDICNVLMEFSQGLSLWIILVTKISFVTAGCAGLGHLANGRVYFRYGGLYVTFTCNPGFRLFGHRSSSCVASKWRRSPPVCVAGGCPVPESSINGHMRFKHAGSIVTFRCDQGYKLFGSSTIYCDGKRWNSTIPVCREFDMMHTIMQKNGLESTKHSIQKNINTPSQLKKLPEDLSTILQGNIVPKSNFKLEQLSSQNHGTLTVRANSYVPLYKDVEYSYHLSDVVGSDTVKMDISKEFEKNDKVNAKVPVLVTIKTAISPTVEATSSSPPVQAKAISRIPSVEEMPSTESTRTPSIVPSTNVKPEKFSASLKALFWSTSITTTSSSTIPYDFVHELVKPHAVKKPSTSSSLTPFFSIVRESSTNSGRPTELDSSASTSLTIPSMTHMPPTSFSLLELPPSGSTGGISLQSLEKTNSNNTTPQTSPLKEAHAVAYRLKAEFKGAEELTNSRAWAYASTAPKHSTEMEKQNIGNGKQLNNIYFLHTDEAKSDVNKNNEASTPSSAGFAYILTDHSSGSVNRSNSSSQSLEPHELTSKSTTAHNERAEQTDTPTTTLPAGSIEFIAVETQVSWKKRPLCTYPPVPDHGTFHFQTMFNPEPHQFRYYIQYTCYPGYAMTHGDIYSFCLGNGTWSGITPICLEFAECSINNGGCSQICRPTEQREIACRCREGFQLQDDGRTCKDVDECAAGSHQCHQSCTNIFGSYRCSCWPGFLLEDDEMTCNDIDECIINNGDCSHHCANTFGSSLCYCPTGFEVDVDQKSCRDINECLLPIGTVGCPLGCVNTPGSFKCNCPDGYRLSTNSWYCIDINECLEMENSEQRCEWKCLDVPGSYVCVCPWGYRISTDRYHCEDVDECAFQKAGCSHICVNTAGGYRCECPSGQELSAYNRRKCQPMKVQNINVKEKTVKAG